MNVQSYFAKFDAGVRRLFDRIGVSPDDARAREHPADCSET